MRRIVWTALLACLAILPLRGAEWVTHSGDNQRTGWQKNENAISKDSVKNLKLLWKITLDTKQRSVYSLYGPLIVERAITDRGFKELAIVAGADNDLFAVDADLGKLFWKKHFEWHADVPETTQASFLCPGGLTAWPVLQPLPQRHRRHLLHQRPDLFELLEELVHLVRLDPGPLSLGYAIVMWVSVMVFARLVLRSYPNRAHAQRNIT